MSIHNQIKNSPGVLYNDKDILLALDWDPISIGHVLILPQNSYHDLDEIPLNIAQKIFHAAQVYVRLLKQEYQATGYGMMQNGGHFNDINIYHLHVFPRFNDQEFGWKKKVKTKQQIDLVKLKERFESALA